MTNGRQIDAAVQGTAAIYRLPLTCRLEFAVGVMDAVRAGVMSGTDAVKWLRQRISSWLDWSRPSTTPPGDGALILAMLVAEPNLAVTLADGIVAQELALQEDCPDLDLEEQDLSTYAHPWRHECLPDRISRAYFYASGSSKPLPATMLETQRTAFRLINWVEDGR